MQNCLSTSAVKCCCSSTWRMISHWHFKFISLNSLINSFQHIEAQQVKLHLKPSQHCLEINTIRHFSPQHWMKAQKFGMLSSRCPSFRPSCCCSAAHNNPSTLALQIAGTKHLTDDIRANQTEIKSHWASCGSQISCYFCITASCRSFRFSIRSEKPKEKPSLWSTFQRLFCKLLFFFFKADFEPPTTGKCRSNKREQNSSNSAEAEWFLILCDDDDDGQRIYFFVVFMSGQAAWQDRRGRRRDLMKLPLPAN